MLPEAAGRGQHFQALGHSFSPYGPTLSQVKLVKLVLQSTNGFVYATLVIESACAPSTYDL